ncbi:MAG TPA: S41 family peptidase [Dongiaceae bacterium]|nr:S41 family peptidase [Dongiaceae bacterium]
MSRRTILTGVFFVLAGSVAGGLFGRLPLAGVERPNDGLGTFSQLLSLVQARAAGKVDSKDSLEGAIRGMLRTLDPHTNYLDADDYRHMVEEQQGSFSGLGIVISKPSTDKPLTVISPLEGTPAWNAGIRAGDVISEIEGDQTLDMSIDEALRRLKGPKGTKVSIAVTRPGDTELLHFTLVRDDIPTNSIRYAFLIRPGIGYIRIDNFTRTTEREMEEKIQALYKQGMTRMVLDLRRNPGGLLDQAVRVADHFLRKGQMIVYTLGRVRGSDQEFRASGTGNHPELPLIVLVDKFSASASEIVSGAIQDHDRGLIVGKPTWGKGLVQTVYPLSQGAALALTTARYYTPSGRLIQRDYDSLEDYLSYEDEGAAEPTAGEQRRTDAGRTVFGGGGIRPDVIVDREPTSKFVDTLQRSQVFFHFAVDYNTRHKNLSKGLEVSPEMLDEFKQFLDKRKLAWTAADFDTDGGRLKVEIRQALASTLWGMEAGYKVTAEIDKQIQRALELFPEAQQLAAIPAAPTATREP